MVALADGTDLGGSLRIPAAFCGVVGLRPSPGLVPQHPVDWVWDTISVAGPMGRTVEDVALMLQVIAGPSPGAPLGSRGSAAATSWRPRRRRCRRACAWATAPTSPASASTRRSRPRAARAAFALADAGAVVEEVACDLSAYRDTFLTLRAEWFLAGMAGRMDRVDDFGVNVRANVEAGLALDPRALGAAHHARGRLWHRMRDLFSRVDYLLTPTTAVPPFPVEQNYPTEVAGRPMRTYVDWFAPTFLLSLDRPADRVGAVRPRRARPAGGPADRRPSAGRGGGADAGRRRRGEGSGSEGRLHDDLLDLPHAALAPHQHTAVARQLVVADALHVQGRGVVALQAAGHGGGLQLEDLHQVDELLCLGAAQRRQRDDAAALNVKGVGYDKLPSDGRVLMQREGGCGRSRRSS